TAFSESRRPCESVSTKPTVQHIGHPRNATRAATPAPRDSQGCAVWWTLAQASSAAAAVPRIRCAARKALPNMPTPQCPAMRSERVWDNSKKWPGQSPAISLNSQTLFGLNRSRSAGQVGVLERQLTYALARRCEDRIGKGGSDHARRRL